MNEWLDLILHGDVGSTTRDPSTAILGLLLAFFIGHVIGWVYMWSHQTLSYSQTFVSSLVSIPVIIALMMMLMSGNIAVAFGLLAVFAVVRFRNVLKDTRDTTFVLWTIIEGMAVGTMRYSTALIGAMVVGLVLLYLRVTSFGNRQRFDAVLNVQLTGDLASGLATLRELLGQHSIRSKLATERRLTDEGLDLSYRLLMRDPSRGEELRISLERTEGMENVALFMRQDESEV
ncbi:MAG: DUF4956 domain-containing protein [Planctomycetales bacterium]|nr:DUF4956 domain-containing protein [Planctomycetales bacterium]